MIGGMSNPDRLLCSAFCCTARGPVYRGDGHDDAMESAARHMGWVLADRGAFCPTHAGELCYANLDTLRGLGWFLSARLVERAACIRFALAHVGLARDSRGRYTARAVYRGRAYAGRGPTVDTAARALLDAIDAGYEAWVAKTVAARA
jgi:hypothetical protein